LDKKNQSKSSFENSIVKNTTRMKTVILEIKKAKNLTVSDINGFSDPYVEIFAYEDNTVVQQFKTRVVHKNLNPKFEETFRITKLKVNLSALNLKSSVQPPVNSSWSSKAKISSKTPF
jgi:Ca2+-dependent lipid-binding protein